MATRKLLGLARCIRRQFSSTAQVVNCKMPVPTLVRPSSLAPNVMAYDRLEDDVKSKVRKLMNPDPRFTRSGTPHAVLDDHTRILSTPQTRITTLPNGLRVATQSDHSGTTATVGIWIDAGSRFESDETNGTAHFLEHMIFKGTSRRSARDLEEEIENMGGHLNAYTSREQTTYYCKVMKEDVPVALDILSDILQNSKFADIRIKRERDVILREMEEVEGQTDEVIFDFLHATAFKHTSLGRTILGPAENIRTITKEHLENYISTHYSAPRMVIVAAGAAEHEDVVSQVKKLFTNLSSNPTTASELVAKEPSIFTGSEVRVEDNNLPLAQFAVAFEGLCWTDPDSIALMVMQTMLGSWNKNAVGGMHVGSELAHKIGKNDMAESTMAFNTNYKDTGLFGVFAIAKPECLSDLAYTIMYEISKLSYRVSEEDVLRARNQLKSSLMLHIDGTSPLAEDIGRQLLTYGRRMPFAELFARVDAVDASTVKRVANRCLFDNEVAISSTGPIQNLPDYNWFRRMTNMSCC